MNKKAQLWGLDLLIGAVIFTIGLTVFYIFSINYSSEEKEGYENLIYESERVASLLLTEGYPVYWNSTNVQQIGLTNERKINQTKLEYFYELSQNSYNLSKNLLGTKYDYFFILDRDIMINGSVISGIGKPGTNISNLNSNNLIKQERFSIYQNNPSSLYLYLWE